MGVSQNSGPPTQFAFVWRLAFSSTNHKGATILGDIVKVYLVIRGGQT